MRKLKEKLFLKEYDEEKIKIANKTARASGASALNKDGSIRSVVGRYVLDNVSKDASILDFGSGPAAVQTLALRDAGFKNVSAYDFGVNTRDGIQDPDALNKKYDVVFASNVLNVSSDEEMLRETLRDIKKAAKNEIVFNYPSSPRKSGLNAQEVKDIIIDEYGVEPELVSGTKSAPVWKVLLNSSKNISEDTVKTRDGKWTNRGDSGETHGEFRTKKQADAQRKAIYASGWKKESVEDLANRVRKNDLEWDDEIEASYAVDGDVAVQFQDRETLTHEVTPYRSRRPRVSSNTWGRIWKDGDLVYNERGPKYKVRDDIIKKLNSMNESFESNLERKLVRMWFNEDQAAWLVKHDPETAEWLAYGNIRTQDLIDVEQEINQKMAVKRIKESSKSLREFKDTKIDATLDAGTPFTNYEVGKLLGIPAKDLLWEVEPNGAGYNPNFRDYIMKDKNGNSYNIRRMLESAPKSDSPKSLKEGRSIKDIDREILRLLEPTSLGVYISRYYEFETSESGLQRFLNIYAPDDMDSFEFNSIRRDVRRVLGNRGVYWNSDDGLIIVDVTSFYKKSDAGEEESLTESEESSSEFYGVFEKGGSIGKSDATRDDLHAWSGRDVGTLVKVFSSSDEAKNYAKRRRSMLSPGERSYYRMGYFVKKLSKKDLEHPQVIDMISNMPGSSASQVDKESLTESDDVWSTPESAAKSLFDRGLVASDYVERACKRHGKDQNFAYEVGVIISQLIEEDEHLGESKFINEDMSIDKLKFKDTKYEGSRTATFSKGDDFIVTIHEDIDDDTKDLEKYYTISICHPLDRKNNYSVDVGDWDDLKSAVIAAKEATDLLNGESCWEDFRDYDDDELVNTWLDSQKFFVEVGKVYIWVAKRISNKKWVDSKVAFLLSKADRDRFGFNRYGSIEEDVNDKFLPTKSLAHDAEIQLHGITTNYVKELVDLSKRNGATIETYDRFKRIFDQRGLHCNNYWWELYNSMMNESKSINENKSVDKFKKNHLSENITKAMRESVESTINDYKKSRDIDIDTTLSCNRSIRVGNSKAPVDTIYIQFQSGFDKYPNLVGYAHLDNGGYDREYLSADDIRNYDLSRYMNGTDITDLEGMLRDNPSILFDVDELNESKYIKEDIDGILNKLGGPVAFRRELMAAVNAYPGIEDDVRELAGMLYGRYEDVISIGELEDAIEYMIDDVLESTESVNSSYSPDLLNDLVNYYRSLDTMSYEKIWDEIVAKYNNEDLANDVIELLDNDEEDFEDEFLGESKSINEDMSEEDYNEFFSIVDKIGPAINTAGGDMDDINGNLSHPYEDEDRIRIVFVSTVDKKDAKKFVKTVEAEIEKAMQTTRFNRVRDIYVYQLSDNDLQMRVPASLRGEFSKKFSMFEIDIRASADL